jgi:hypothetical protein
MERARLQMSVAGLLGLVACIAVNVWLFRLGPLLGILGLNVTKHVLIAYLCQAVGVNRKTADHVPMPGAGVLPPRAAADAGPVISAS